MKITKILRENTVEEGVTHYNVHLVELDDGGKGIWKIDKKYYDPPITALKEVVAYRISKWLGLPVIPETDFCYLDGNPGSVQRFIDGVSGTTALRVGKPEIKFEWAQKLGLCDYFLNNCDRWHPNMLVDNSGRVWGIDNAGALQTRDAWTASAWAIVGVELPQELKEIVLKARQNVKELIKVIFDTQYKCRDGRIITGGTLDIGVNIMCEKISCLAGALGFEQDLYSTWGCPDYKKIKEEILNAESDGNING